MDGEEHCRGSNPNLSNDRWDPGHVAGPCFPLLVHFYLYPSSPGCTGSELLCGADRLRKCPASYSGIGCHVVWRGKVSWYVGVISTHPGEDELGQWFSKWGSQTGHTHSPPQMQLSYPLLHNLMTYMGASASRLGFSKCSSPHA